MDTLQPTASIARLERSSSSVGHNFTAQLAPHLPRLRRFALRLTRDTHDADDLVQDVLLKLYERPDRMSDIELLQPWLMRVMYHHFIDRRRRQSHAEFVSLDDVSEPDEHGHELVATDHNTDDVIDRLQLTGAITRAIDRLPEPQRLLVHLHDIEGQTLPEIAARFGWSINTIKSSLSRARVRLRSSLRPDGPGLSTPSIRRRATAPARTEEHRPLKQSSVC